MTSRREILERVASGDLTPEEADELLRGLEGEDAPDREPDEGSPATTPDAVRTVKVSAGFGAILIEGDPRVAGAEVDGKHSMTLDGDVLVVRGEQWTDHEPIGPGHFSIHVGGRRRVRKFRFGDLNLGERSNLRIRMNPDLALDARIDAGPLSISGLHAAVRARSAAGPITIEDFQGPLDVAVNAGAIRASGKLTHGESRIRSDAGAVRVELDPSSSVRIRAEAALGKVLVVGNDDVPKRGRFGSDRQETVIGNGAATLRVETAMGSIHVTTA